MAREFFDYDPLTGISTYTDYDEATDRMTVISEQDIEPLLNRNAELRNTGGTTQGIKDNWWFVATIPLTVITDMQRKGIDPFDANNEKKVAQMLQSDYKYLCVTDKKW